MKKKGIINFLRIIPAVLIGNVLYALGVTAFIVPNGLITGGTTGLALFFSGLLQIPVSAFVTASNIFMFLLGAAVLGKRFAASTLLSTVAYPMVLAVIESLPITWNITDDPLLAAVFAGLLIGVGMGIILRTGASSGGLDIPPLILKKKLGIPVSVTMYVIDFAILILQMFRASTEAVLYGIILVIIYTVVIDKALLLGKSQIRAEIITPKSQEMAAALRDTMDRGCTYYKGKGGYTEEEQLIIMIAVSSRELPKLKEVVSSVDPSAFFVVSKVSEVVGRGFSSQKEYK